jgi:TPR repeat protein
MYALGRVEVASPVDALDWFLKAAEQGDKKAQCNLNCLQLDNDPLGNPHFVI